MNLILLLVMALPQEYVNILLAGQYEAALGYCNERIAKGDVLAWQLEKGDIFYDKFGAYEAAAALFQDLIDNYGDRDGWIHYRLALALEMHEDFLNAAKAYEIVATQFRTPPLDSFALSGVERCFKKNYQDYVASVDGFRFTRLELDEMLAKSGMQAQKGEQAIIDQMILQRLIYTNALKEKIEDTEYCKEGKNDARKELYLEEIRNLNVVAKAEPTEKEMERYYNKNKEKYVLREEVRVKEIIVESDSLAHFLLDTLQHDIESFDTLAKIYSTVPSKRTGGNMGVVYRGTRPEPADDILFSTEPNTLTDILFLDGKYAIFYITSHKPERYRDYESVKNQVRTAVRAEKIEELEQDFAKNLRRKAKVKVYKDVVRNPMATEEDKLVAVVNEREIWKSDVIAKNQSQMRMAQVDLSDSDAFEGLLDAIIDESIKLEYAERNKYFLYNGYTIKMRDKIHALMENGLYQRIVIEGVTADSQEVTEYYDKHKEEYRVPETIRALELVVTSKERAHELHQILVRAPQEFDSLAREYSIAPTKTDGGKTGIIRRGMRSKIFENNVFKLNVGEVSDVFSETDSTFTICLLTEHEPETYRTVDEMRRTIESTLLRQQRNQVATEYLDTIKAQANIEILLEPASEESPIEENK
jgi:parvulin-like peptidyl-prolyl isomerase